MFGITLVVQTYFIILTSGLLMARINPLTKRWMCYGKTLDEPDSWGFYKRSIFGYTVPKKWFIHFYVVSTISNCFWIIQICRCRFYGECGLITYFSQDRMQSLFKVYVCVLFMSIHGVRRLYESFFIQKHSDARMWIGHYFLGMTYYIFCSLGMWCEGGGNLQNPEQVFIELKCVSGIITVLFSVLVYVFFSWAQHSTHIGLSKLRSDPNMPKYSLPTTGLFKYLVCPHYTSEIGIYFSLILATHAQNKTIFIIFIWVLAILTISASETYRWYLRTFRIDASYLPWIIFPGIY
ncbi:uncharacterized protein T551_00234 [Pneumocystis jirovecii RU7]|uniref:Polyprenal reductase n=1 Tax=Pneumocystis jirovecii (strain RU7) TaxID=1408657 RepID=A0A0W4ZWJ9_PNEJ7|nr:uncharacterized protein T551_00234 [Pneumocystis jirovecii RU7]KTW32749.1 hypothetical protein T551_00234 [Pneumocystis jirovecii RU7]